MGVVVSMNRPHSTNIHIYNAADRLPLPTIHTRTHNPHVPTHPPNYLHQVLLHQKRRGLRGRLADVGAEPRDVGGGGLSGEEERANCALCGCRCVVVLMNTCGCRCGCRCVRLCWGMSVCIGGGPFRRDTRTLTQPPGITT